MQAFELFPRQRRAGARHVQGLAAAHAGGAGGVRQRRQPGHAQRMRRAGLFGEQAEGLGLQRIAGEDGGGFVVGHVHGRAAAAQVVVVHGRQVVMNQGIAVQTFEGATDLQGGIVVSAEKARRLHHEIGAQPLPPLRAP